MLEYFIAFDVCWDMFLQLNLIFMLFGWKIVLYFTISQGAANYRKAQR